MNMHVDHLRHPSAVALVCALLFFATTVSVQAGCTLTEGGGRHVVNLGKQQVRVSPDMQVGAVILTVSSDRSAVPKYSCRNLKSIQPTASRRSYRLTGSPPIVVGMNKTYETGVKGIGVQVFASNTSWADKYHFPLTETTDHPLALFEDRHYTLSSHGATYRFVRTSLDSGHGVIHGGALPTAVAHAFMPDEPDPVAEFLFITGAGTVEIVAPTCHLAAASKAQTVTLPAAVVGSIQDSRAPSTTFSIEVNNCAHASSVRFTFQGQPAGAVGTPAGAWLKNNGTAQGVGIGIQSVIGTDAQDIRFDKKGGANVRSLKPGADRGAKLALKASYQALAPGTPKSVTPGSVDATATVQVDYL